MPSGTTTRSQKSRTARGRRVTGVKRQRQARRWSRQVAERSDALDLERGVFTSGDPRRVARSLKRSAEASRRRKAGPFQSAMSMLNLYINRAGRTLPASRRRVLEQAKDELRALFGRTSGPPRTRRRATTHGARVTRARRAAARER